LFLFSEILATVYEEKTETTWRTAPWFRPPIMTQLASVRTHA